MDRQDTRPRAGRPETAQEPGAGADPARGEPSGPGRPERPSPPGLPRRGLRFLRSRGRVVVRLVLWSVLEAAQTFLTGYALARALDDGFLAGRPGAAPGRTPSG
ncbi:hypothetical protein PV374_28565, partial [Streptomyces scabiei]|nr:hypothetical protein [Streptomyces scabiei]